MAVNTKQTSAKIAELASAIMKSSRASHVQKQLAAAALAQRNTAKQTGKAMEQLASKVMRNKRYAEVTRKLAASVHSQANRDR